MIDAAILAHLRAWVMHQFGKNNEPLIVAMLAIYLDDPEIYDREGWWRCHDDMVASGRSTL